MDSGVGRFKQVLGWIDSKGMKIWGIGPSDKFGYGRGLVRGVDFTLDIRDGSRDLAQGIGLSVCPE